MAFSESTVSADEVTAKDRDYPMLVGINMLERSSVAAQWRTSGSWSAGGDATHSAGPTRLAYDRNGKTQTRPNLPTNTVDELSLIFDVDDSTSDEGSFDTAFILGHNFDMISNLSTVTLEVSDNADFSSAQTAAQWIGPLASNARLMSLSLFGTASAPNTRYVNARYIRLHFAASSNFVVYPALAELWLGRRRQLAAYPNLSYPMNPRRAGVVDLETDSGNIVRHKLYAGRADRELTFETGGGIIGTLDTAESFDDWIADIDSGAKPFLFVEHPSSGSTRKAYLVQLDPPEFVRTANLGPYDSEVTLNMIELPRFIGDED